MSDQDHPKIIVPGHRCAMPPDPFQLMLGGVVGLQHQNQRILEAIGKIYSPDPRSAVQWRAKKPEKETLNLALVYDPDVDTELRGPVVWTSHCLDTDGFTLHCAYVRLEVFQDSVAPGLGDRRLFTVVLEGQAGSPFAECDQAPIASTGRTGAFPVPLLASQDLSLQTRVVLYAADNAVYTEQHPWQQRHIEVRIDLVLVSGLTF